LARNAEEKYTENFGRQRREESLETYAYIGGKYQNVTLKWILKKQDEERGLDLSRSGQRQVAGCCDTSMVKHVQSKE